MTSKYTGAHKNIHTHSHAYIHTDKSTYKSTYPQSTHAYINTHIHKHICRVDETGGGSGGCAAPGPVLCYVVGYLYTAKSDTKNIPIND